MEGEFDCDTDAFVIAHGALQAISDNYSDSDDEQQEKQKWNVDEYPNSLQQWNENAAQSHDSDVHVDSQAETPDYKKQDEPREVFELSLYNNHLEEAEDEEEKEQEQHEIIDLVSEVDGDDNRLESENEDENYCRVEMRAEMQGYSCAPIMEMSGIGSYDAENYGGYEYGFENVQFKEEEQREEREEREEAYKEPEPDQQGRQDQRPRKYKCPTCGHKSRRKYDEMESDTGLCAVASQAETSQDETDSEFEVADDSDDSDNSGEEEEEEEDEEEELEGEEQVEVEVPFPYEYLLHVSGQENSLSRRSRNVPGKRVLSRNLKLLLGSYTFKCPMPGCLVKKRSAKKLTKHIIWECGYYCEEPPACNPTRIPRAASMATAIANVYKERPDDEEN